MARSGEFGKNWWARRWISVLESFGWSNRLQRGRSYARYGNVLEVVVAPGEVRAKVQGSRARPYRVTIRVKPLDDAEWEKVTSAMAEQAVFAARLLAGEMPENIEEVFTRNRVSLFPSSGRDIVTTCSCPDWANPCKHVAAVYYVLGQEFDRDPFLLFLLRGRSRDGLMAALRAKRMQAECPGVDRRPSPRRAAAPAKHDCAASRQGAEGVGGGCTGTWSGAGNGARDDGQAVLEAVFASTEAFWAGDVRKVEALPVSVSPPVVPGAIAKRLGVPRPWRSSRDFDEGRFAVVLADYYKTVSREALSLAYDGGGNGTGMTGCGERAGGDGNADAGGDAGEPARGV